MFTQDVFKIAILVTVLFKNTVRAAEEPCIVNHFSEVSNAVKNCKNIILDSLSIPGGEKLTLNLTEGSAVILRGHTYFNFQQWEGPLIEISGFNISVKGEEGLILDGQGPLYWDGQGGWGNITKPRFVKITATNAILDGINLLNCPMTCVGINASQNVSISNWNIDNLAGDEGVAPANKSGHNTDGFGVENSQNILIEDSVIYNQDDCVVFNSGKNFTVKNVFCHGSHGLSISVTGGSTIEDVTIENSKIVMASNGIHIKNHLDTGNGLMKNILYRNITILDSKECGVNIQQNYRNLPHGDHPYVPPENNIPFYNITLENIYGNVLQDAVPVYILCADEGCFDWKWEGVQIYGAKNDNCTNYIPEGYSCS